MGDLKAVYREAFDAFLRKDYDAAIEAYERAIGMDARFALAYQGLAEAHSKKGDLESAIRAIKSAIELEPEESLFHTSLSRFYQMEGRIPEAETESAIAARLQARGRL
jgi:tetratricopeptide (TPR) repeat protein